MKLHFMKVFCNSNILYFEISLSIYALPVPVKAALPKKLIMPIDNNEEDLSDNNERKIQL